MPNDFVESIETPLKIDLFDTSISNPKMRVNVDTGILEDDVAENTGLRNRVVNLYMGGRGVNDLGFGYIYDENSLPEESGLLGLARADHPPFIFINTLKCILSARLSGQSIEEVLARVWIHELRHLEQSWSNSAYMKGIENLSNIGDIMYGIFYDESRIVSIGCLIAGGVLYYTGQRNTVAKAPYYYQPASLKKSMDRRRFLQYMLALASGGIAVATLGINPKDRKNAYKNVDPAELDAKLYASGNSDRVQKLSNAFEVIYV